MAVGTATTAQRSKDPSMPLCLQSGPPCFEKYTSLVPSAFCSDICQANQATTILWTPDPSSDQAGTAATAGFSTNIMARAFSRGTQANHSSKSQARYKTTAGTNKPKQRQV